MPFERQSASVTLESIDRQSRRADEAGGSDEWVVQSVRERAGWRDGAAACPACGRTVALDGPHVGAQLLRERSDAEEQKRRHDHRLVALCDRDCADAWLARD
jgi:hypothetical protein